MLWLRKITQRFFDTQYWSNQYREKNPDYQPQFNVFQSSDFPHVFLGGEDDLQEAEQMAGQPICKVVDCRDLPEIDQTAWDYPEFLMVQRDFDAKVKDLIQKISNTSCPIFVHCALGANRSVAVLASALTQLTGKSVNQVLSEMKQVRAFVGPQDPYYLMALQQSPSETPEFKQQVFDELDQDFPLIQPGLPTNTAQTEIPSDFPDNLLGDLDLLHQEKQWRNAVSTPGSLVAHNDYGWTGKVIELRGDPANGGVVLVEYPLSAEEAERLGSDEGYVVQRFHRALSLSPVMQLASPFHRTSSWLVRVAQELDSDKEVWTYEDYKNKFPETHDSYESIGHTSPNTSLWKIDAGLKFHNITPNPKEVSYEKRHHGLLDDPNLSITEQSSISHGRVDMDTKEGSINLIGNNLGLPNVRDQMRIFDILVSQYPGIRFFVWAGSVKKVPLQRYVESISR